MQHHYVCITVNDMDESLKLYRDFLGFNVVIKDQICDQPLNGAKKTRNVFLADADGNILELDQPIDPKVKKLTREELQVGYTGIKEVAFWLGDNENLEEWWNKVKAAGYETTTNTIIPELRLGRTSYSSFLFYDPDGNKVQLQKEVKLPALSKPKPVFQFWGKPFWDNCRKEKLTIQKCRDCGKFTYPAKLICPGCLAENLEWVEASGKGKVYTYSATQPQVLPYLMPQFADANPFILAIIELEEGVRMTATVVECAIEDMRCEMPVEVVFEKRDEEFTIPQFKPRR